MPLVVAVLGGQRVPCKLFLTKINKTVLPKVPQGGWPQVLLRLNRIFRYRKAERLTKLTWPNILMRRRIPLISKSLNKYNAFSEEHGSTSPWLDDLFRNARSIPSKNVAETEGSSFSWLAVRGPFVRGAVRPLA